MGAPIAHSMSPQIHAAFAAQLGIELVYERLLVESELEVHIARFFHSGGRGLNITLPHKQHAAALAQSPSLRVRAAQAANTLWMHDGKLHADNTDGLGLVADLNRLCGISGKRILMLGAGGAAAGVMLPLLDAGAAELVIANRTAARAEELAARVQHAALRGMGLDALAQEEARRFDLVINATSAGTQSELVAPPAHVLSTQAYAYDMFYSKNEAEPTMFCEWAQQGGIANADGLGMLVEQAACAFEIWHGVKPRTQTVLASVRRALA
jgi:shikimate dehydrogenase